MARKNDSFYFDGFKQSADYACQAAHLLSEVMHHYEPDRLLERFDEMHRIEQAADEVRHGMMDELVTAFITPFDRDDIARLSSVLDDVTDRIEGALHRMYYDNVLEIRPDALDLVDMVERSCGKMADPLQVLAWHEVYVHLELCTDDCEHVADVVDNIVMENS